MIGFLGLLGWKVTVISSNFIALMLILTMAMNIHMSTRFLQLRKQFPKLKKIKNYSYDNSKNVMANFIYCSYNCMCIFIFDF